MELLKHDSFQMELDEKGHDPNYELRIHSVERIVLSPIQGPDYRVQELDEERVWVRTLSITTDTGATLTIRLHAQGEALLVIEEERPRKQRSGPRSL